MYSFIRSATSENLCDFALDFDLKSSLQNNILNQNSMINNTDMIPRILNLNNEIDSSIFLFEARQTGKSTILRQQFPQSIYIDLLDNSIKER